LAERSLTDRLMERGMTHAGADDELAVDDGDAIERLDAIDVDEMRRLGGPKRHGRDETLAAGQHTAVVGGKFGEQRDRLVDRFRRVIAECRGLHRASVPIPKFASVCGASDANFGIKGTLVNL